MEYVPVLLIKFWIFYVIAIIIVVYGLIKALGVFFSTRLHRAIKSGNLKSITPLIRWGKELNNYDSTGYTPLHYAVINDNLQVALLLLEKGADANLRDKNKGWGLTPFQMAINNENYDMVNMFIDHGADVNIKINSDGDSPLHYAIESGNTDMVNKLISHGADVSKKNNKGVSPADLNSNRDKKKFEEILNPAVSHYRKKKKEIETSLLDKSYCYNIINSFKSFIGEEKFSKFVNVLPEDVLSVADHGPKGFRLLAWQEICWEDYTSSMKDKSAGKILSQLNYSEISRLINIYQEEKK